MNTKHEISFNINGPVQDLTELMKDAGPELYVETMDGRTVPVCRIEKHPDCPDELFAAVLKALMK